MKIEGTHTFKAPREIVWRVLLDPQVIARCVPGCRQLEPEAENQYRAVLELGVASIRGTYTGTFRLRDLNPPTRYGIVFEGRGPQGFAKGTGTLILEERDAETSVHYSGDVQVGGPIAGVGQRLLQGTARMLAGQFFTALEAEIAALQKAGVSGAPASVPRHGILRTFLRYVWNRVRAFFRRR
ncbi:MAG: carbon monoxide dehydrogenase subunit G [Acidobacteriota bacterium]|nr:carbon monoxide dehydrogenase subunit G [Acidobacteriota bacterium]